MGLGQTFEERRYEKALLEKRKRVCQKNAVQLLGTLNLAIMNV